MKNLKKSRRVPKKGLSFSWSQIAELLEVEEWEARDMARPKYTPTVYKEGVGDRRKLKQPGGGVLVRDALFDPRSLRSLFDFVCRTRLVERDAELCAAPCCLHCKDPLRGEPAELLDNSDPSKGGVHARCAQDYFHYLALGIVWLP